MISSPVPLYVVACSITPAEGGGTHPIILGGADLDGSGSLDDELVPALPALWYALHLPRSRFDTLDLPLGAISEYLSERRPHAIALIPAELLSDVETLKQLVAGYEPVLIIHPPNETVRAWFAHESCGFVLPPISFASLSQETLASQWSELANKWSMDWPTHLRASGDPTAPQLALLTNTSGSALPVRRLRRLMAATNELNDFEDGPCSDALELLYCRTWLETLILLEDEGVPMDLVDARIAEVLPGVAAAIRIPLTAAFPGISPKYVRLAAAASQSSPTPSSPKPASYAWQGAKAADSRAELDALSLVAAHRASSDESMCVVFDEAIPPSAFHALADLERHWIEGPKPQKVKKLLERLDATMTHIWTPGFLTLLSSASQLDAYTNFPIGLIRPPNSTSPLAARIPIAYHPLAPMTRALQSELSPQQFADFSDGYSVLVAECIAPEDPVGAASRAGWNFAAQNLSTSSVSITVEETLSTASLRQAVAEHRPDVLIISAHGFSSPDSNVAGLVIGNEHTMGVDLGPMPPLVILSACHSAPRGGSVVAITDLLLRAGAKAVLSTLVPVQVRHNSLFMTRFLVYLSESIGGVEDHADVLSVWHRVQASNVIIDIASGNEHLTRWVNTRNGHALSPLVDFMSTRSRGRLSPEHIYRDAEEVLLEIAAEQGSRPQVASWLRAPGYLPEAMMYTLVGDPSAIRLVAKSPSA